MLALVYNSCAVYDPASSRVWHNPALSSPRRAEDAGPTGKLRFARSCKSAFQRRSAPSSAKQPATTVDHNVVLVDDEVIDHVGGNSLALTDDYPALGSAELTGAPQWALNILKADTTTAGTFAKM